MVSIPSILALFVRVQQLLSKYRLRNRRSVLRKRPYPRTQSDSPGCSPVFDSAWPKSYPKTRSLLDLFGAPASNLGLAHVDRGLDRRNVLEDDEADADNADSGASDLAEHRIPENKTAEEDVDWRCQIRVSGVNFIRYNLQAPRPMREKRNEA